MQKIGEIAKLVGVNVKTVRYYEEMGLLKPAFVDETSGFTVIMMTKTPKNWNRFCT